MKGAFFLFFLFFAFNLYGGTLITELPNPSGASYGKCVRVYQSGPNGSAFAFYNGCGEKLMINACAEGSFNKTQLFQSGRTINIGGRFNIFPFFDIDVKKITWSAHPYQPLIPICGVPKKK